MSQITTHILDTTSGKPAEGVKISLKQLEAETWKLLAWGYTNKDGRITDLLDKDVILPSGLYKLKFETKMYFDNLELKTFYPFIEITFEIATAEHYHVPLLLNPFGYSTYRGS